jgi:hypothetical protein
MEGTSGHKRELLGGSFWEGSLVSSDNGLAKAGAGPATRHGVSAMKRLGSYGGRESQRWS